jgi:hypothetical protein
MTENDKALFRAFFVAYYMKNTKTMPGHIARGDSIDQKIRSDGRLNKPRLLPRMPITQ